MTAPTPGVRSSPRSEQRSRRSGARLLSVLGIGATAGAVLLVGALHVLPGTAGISPVRRTISEYALTDWGWLFNLAAITLALGSLAVLTALALAGQTSGRSAGSVLGALWVAALLTVVLFPKHNWAVGASANGQVHRAASIVAFLCLPIAVLLLTRRTVTSGTGIRSSRPVAARTAGWLAVLSLAWFAPLLGAILLFPVTGTPWYQAIPLGLVERGLVASEVLAVIALGAWALSATKRTRSPRPASRAQPAPAG